MPASLLPIVLVVHVVLAVSLFLPSILLPLTLRPVRRAGGGGRAAPASAAPDAGRLARVLLWLQAHGSVAIGLGLLATGALLVTLLGVTLLERPWLLVALVIYALNLVLAFFVQRPNLRRLIGFGARGDDETWIARARRQRYVSYVMAGLVGTIGFLMSAKPELW
jgi:hypothetical protein